jgi:Protein of unknown function DUF2617
VPLHQLVVAPADVSGAKLRLALNAPAQRPLATHLLRHPDGGTLLLGVLGASHAVSISHAALRFSEQVSCASGSESGELPERAEAPGYSLESHTERRGEAAFRRLARDLRQRCAAETGWLGGTFPGDDAALTALAAEPVGAGWHWRTWHLYPGAPGGTVVYTASRWQP